MTYAAIQLVITAVTYQVVMATVQPVVTGQTPKSVIPGVSGRDVIVVSADEVLNIGHFPRQWVAVGIPVFKGLL